MEKQKSSKKICIYSVDESIRASLQDNLKLLGYEIKTVSLQTEIFSAFEKEKIDIVILDIENMPGQEIDVVNYIKVGWVNTEIIVLASIHELETATLALRNGASFYLIKPVEFTDIKILLDKLALKLDRQHEHVELEQRVLSDLMVGSPAMQKVLKLAIKIAPTASTVLIGGESGTGKEFFARIIHRMSDRYAGNFIAANCGAIPDTLFESELFGHKKGSFTGADRDKAGLVEDAHMGTLFLDEVGELTPSAQVKLLRFLQERTFRRIGDNTLRSVNVRIIAASNRDLNKLMEEGKFREDLFYRINVFYLHLPPLRERKETIPNLIRLFVHKNNQIQNKQVAHISKSAEVALAGYDYPGNVRELENIIEHAIVLATGNEIHYEDLPPLIARNKLMLTAPHDCGEITDASQILPLVEVERNHIEQALRVLEFNYTEASKRLGVSRSTLWRKIKEYSIAEPKK